MKHKRSYFKFILAAMGLFVGTALGVLLHPAETVHATAEGVGIVTKGTEYYSTNNNAKENIKAWYNQNKDYILANTRFGYIDFNGDEIEQDDGDDYDKSDEYALSCKNGTKHNLYMLEFSTNTPGGTCPDYDMKCSIIYVDKWGWVRYLEPFDLGDECNAFYWYDKKTSFNNGRKEYLTFTLPTDCEYIVGVYLANWSGKKHDGEPWCFPYFSISKVTGYVDVYELRSTDKYPGQYIATIADSHTNLTAEGFDSCVYPLLTPAMSNLANPSSTVSNDKYVLSLVNGEVDNSGQDVSILVNYMDQMNVEREAEFFLKNRYLSPHGEDQILTSTYNYNYTLDYHSVGKPVPIESFDHTYWNCLSMKGFVWPRLTSMGRTNLLAGYYCGNYLSEDTLTDSYLQPYSATDLIVNFHGGLSKVNSVTIKASSDKQLTLQSIAIYKSSRNFNPTCLNGGMSKQRVIKWSGTLLARSVSHSISVYPGSSKTLSLDGTTDDTKLVWDGETQYSNLDNLLGINLKVADYWGAGIELLAHNPAVSGEKGASDVKNPDGERSYVSVDNFNKINEVNPNEESEVCDWFASFGAYFEEPLTLTVTYLDVFGNTRRVSIPFLTAYKLQLIDDMQYENEPYAFWGGILQQGDDAALRFYLAQYKELVSLDLCYGQSPDGISCMDTIKGRKRLSEKDMLSIRSVSFYENLSDNQNFKMVRNGAYSLKLNTGYTPTLYYKSVDEKGDILGLKNHLIMTTGDDGNLRNVANGNFTPVNDFNGCYLFQLDCESGMVPSNSNGEDSYYQITYTDKSGEQKTTEKLSLKEAMLNYYGPVFNLVLEMDYTGDHTHAGDASSVIYSNPINIVARLPDAETIDSITFTGVDGTSWGWQINTVTVTKLAYLWPRTVIKDSYGSNYISYIDRFHMTRLFTGREVGSSTNPMLLNADNGLEGTFYFTKKYDANGQEILPDKQPNSVENQYLTKIPWSMTFAETQKNLGLAVVKSSYRVDVKVSDAMDSGSTNNFYFQLEFSDGNTSGVVLANEQLAADGFRQGYTESFTIKTTQNYGAVTGVRIICDSTSSNAQVFDKLNIEKISVTLSNSSGLGKSWVIDNVGWIDINYQDEGVKQYASEQEVLQLSNEDICKKFRVNRVVSTMTFLFTVTKSDNVLQLIKYDSTMELSYLDSKGKPQNITVNLKDALNAYSPYRNSYKSPTEHFLVTLDDVQSFQSISICRRDDGERDYTIGNISIQQVGELGKLLYVNGGYYREEINSTEIAQTNVINGWRLKVGTTTSQPFSKNNIQSTLLSDDASEWSSTIESTTTVNNSELNIYVYPGTLAGQTDVFGANTPALKAEINYTNTYGRADTQTVTLKNYGTSNGVTAMYAMGVDLSKLGNAESQTDVLAGISSLIISSTEDRDVQPTVGYAKIERIVGDVIVETLYFNFGGADLTYPATAYPTDGNIYVQPMTQLVRMRLKPDQIISLTPQYRDVAVALLYTSELEPDETTTKHVYRSPYVYLTDFDYINLQEALNLELAFDVQGVKEIVGLQVQSQGPSVKFENALITNYRKNSDKSRGTRLSTCSLVKPFTSTIEEQKLMRSSDGNDVVADAVLTFTTPDKFTVKDAGTSGVVKVVLKYIDVDGNEQEYTVDKLLNYLEDDQRPTENSTVTYKLTLPNAFYLTSATITPETDPWYLTNVTATLTDPTGNVINSSTYVNNWASKDTPLTVDLRPDSMKKEGDSWLSGFSISGSISGSTRTGTSFTGTSGNVVTTTVYPGETITMTPVIISQGNPDTSVSWNYAGFEDYVSVNGSGVATVTIPPVTNESSPVGKVFDLSATCNGNSNLTVKVLLDVKTAPAATATPTPSATPTPTPTTETGSMQISATTINADGSFESTLSSGIYTGAQTLRLNAVRGKTVKLKVALSRDNTVENGFCYWDSTDENKLQTITVTLPESFNVGDSVTRKAVFNDGDTGTKNFEVTVYIQAIEDPHAEPTETPAPTPTPAPPATPEPAPAPSTTE